jgi:hypothetical protein
MLKIEITPVARRLMECVGGPSADDVRATLAEPHVSVCATDHYVTAATRFFDDGRRAVFVYADTQERAEAPRVALALDLRDLDLPAGRIHPDRVRMGITIVRLVASSFGVPHTYDPSIPKAYLYAGPFHVGNGGHWIEIDPPMRPGEAPRPPIHLANLLEGYVPDASQGPLEITSEQAATASGQRSGHPVITMAAFYQRTRWARFGLAFWVPRYRDWLMSLNSLPTRSQHERA